MYVCLSQALILSLQDFYLKCQPNVAHVYISSWLLFETFVCIYFACQKKNKRYLDFIYISCILVHCFNVLVYSHEMIAWNEFKCLCRMDPKIFGKVAIFMYIKKIQNNCSLCIFHISIFSVWIPIVIFTNTRQIRHIH